MIDAISKLDGVTALDASVFERIEASASESVNLTPSMGTSTGLVRVTNAWELGYTGEGMVVAILDTGIHSTHEAFSVNPENSKIDKAYLQKVFSAYGDKLQRGTDAVIWAYNAEVVNGVSETAFAPNANITREQLVAVLYRFYGEPETNTLVLADYADANTISDYAVNAMAWAVENGIVNGLTETTLAPQGAATRAQIATILMRLA